jgi:hypothetical protein
MYHIIAYFSFRLDKIVLSCLRCNFIYKVYHMFGDLGFSELARDIKVSFGYWWTTHMQKMSPLSKWKAEQ